MIEATAEGQVVITIAVGPIARDLQANVTEISSPHEAKVSVGGHTYTVVLTPDLEAGGFTVAVPELPGCLTEGDTLAEAKAMARDAIAGWLSVQARRTRRAAQAE